MRTEIITCDGPCGLRLSVVHRHGTVPGEYCWECLRQLIGAPPDDVCQHEDNASDEAQGRDTARLVCKNCGFDRVEKVA